MRIERNLRLMTAYTVCANAMFFIGVMLPYYKEIMGLSFQDLLIGEAVFATVTVLCEVPLGWLSDQWQRRYVLALGVAANTCGHILLLVGNNLWWVLAAQAVIGIGISLISGTNTAMVYDNLLSVGQEKHFRRHESTRSAVGFYSIATACLISGFLYKIDPYLPIIINIVFLCGAVICALMMDEPERHRARPEKHPLADMMATMRYALRGHTEVATIIFFASIMFCATKLIMWSQQPYYMAIGLDESLFGVLMAVGFILAGVSSHLGHKLDGKKGNLTVLLGVWLTALCVCIATGLYQGLAGVGLLMIGGSCLYGLGGPRVSEAINARVDSSRRATILSTQSLMVSLFFVPTSLLVGWISERGGIGHGLLAIAGWLMVGGVALVATVFLTRRNSAPRTLR